MEGAPHSRRRALAACWPSTRRGSSGRGSPRPGRRPAPAARRCGTSCASARGAGAGARGSLRRADRPGPGPAHWTELCTPNPPLPPQPRTSPSAKKSSGPVVSILSHPCGASESRKSIVSIPTSSPRPSNATDPFAAKTSRACVHRAGSRGARGPALRPSARARHS